MEKKSIWAEMQEELNSLPEEERARLRAESRERAMMEERAALHYARAEGWAIGFAKGVVKGLSKAQARSNAKAWREIANQMIASGVSEERVRPILDLSPDE